MVKRTLAIRLLKKDTEKISNRAKKSWWYGIGYKLLSQYLITYNYPLHVHLELSRSCNYNCVMCVRQKMAGRKGHMPLGMAVDIVKQMIKAGPTSYALHMFGEPLLYPHLKFIVKFTKFSHPQNNIILVTNGSLLKPEMARWGIDRVYVSLPHLHKETYNKMTGGDLDRVQSNILEFIKMKSKTKLLVRYFGEDCPEVWRWRTDGIPFEFKKFHNYAGGTNDWSKLDRRITPYPCFHRFYTLNITFDGDIRICCADWDGSTSLGNIKNTTIKEVWQKAVGREFDLCKKCDIWQYKANMFFDWQY